MDFSSSTSLRYSITCSGAEFMISKHVTRTIDCIFAMETKSVRSASSASTAGSMGPWRAARVKTSSAAVRNTARERILCECEHEIYNFTILCLRSTPRPRHPAGNRCSRGSAWRS